MPLSLIHIKIFFCSEVVSVAFFFLWESFSVDKTQKGQTHKVTSMEKVTLNYLGFINSNKNPNLMSLPI